MACPFFLPVRALQDPAVARTPLGAFFAGVCRARPDRTLEPPERRQRELCNRGYAKGECDCFPADAPADAVRFSITGAEDGCIRFVYVLERDHAPVEHGALEYRGDLAGAEGREVLAAQARAFVASYRRRAAPI